MQSAKARVQGMIDLLPDDVTIEDIQYHLYVARKIEEGLADIEAGRTISHEEVEKYFNDKWLR